MDRIALRRIVISLGVLALVVLAVAEGFKPG